MSTNKLTAAKKLRDSNMNEFDKDFADTILRRIDAISDELARVKRAVLAAADGQPFEEAFNEEVYSEEVKDKKDLRSDLANLMEHILKLKYCTVNRYHNGWRESVIKHIQDIRRILEWRSAPNTLLIKYSRDILKDAYAEAIGNYDELTELYPDLIPNKAYIPKECPWELDDLLSVSLSNVLNKLPDPDKLTVQMMLYPDICEYLDVYELSDFAIDKTCSLYWCPHCLDCVRKYAETRYEHE